MLPELNATYPISEAQSTEYQQNGHILLRNVLNADELAVYRHAIVDAADRYNPENRPIEERDTYGKAFLQIMNLWEVDEKVRKFVLAKRFGQIAADLMGVEKARLYHDQALFKEPFGGHTPWHQDQFYWPIASPKTVTMWMPLVDINIEMGMLSFATGSHHNGMALNVEISDESEDQLSNLVKEKGYPISRAETMKAGDATFHAGWTLHFAPANHTDQMREVMTIIFVADETVVKAPENSYQESDHKRWLMSKPIGEKIDSALNPVLN